VCVGFSQVLAGAGRLLQRVDDAAWGSLAPPLVLAALRLLCTPGAAAHAGSLSSFLVAVAEAGAARPGAQAVIAGVAGGVADAVRAVVSAGDGGDRLSALLYTLVAVGGLLLPPSDAANDEQGGGEEDASVGGCEGRGMAPGGDMSERVAWWGDDADEAADWSGFEGPGDAGNEPAAASDAEPNPAREQCLQVRSEAVFEFCQKPPQSTPISESSLKKQIGVQHVIHAQRAQHPRFPLSLPLLIMHLCEFGRLNCRAGAHGQRGDGGGRVYPSARAAGAANDAASRSSRGAAGALGALEQHLPGACGAGGRGEPAHGACRRGRRAAGPRGGAGAASAGRRLARHYRNEGPSIGCQIGTKYPILHAY
jgi:hypothetical protein